MDVLDSAIHKTQIDLQVKDRTGYNMDIREKWSPKKKTSKQTKQKQTNKKRKQKHTNIQVKKNKYKQATTKKETKGENKKKNKQTNKRNKTKHKNTSSVLNQMTPFINGKYFYMMIQMTIK